MKSCYNPLRQHGLRLGMNDGCAVLTQKAKMRCPGKRKRVRPLIRLWVEVWLRYWTGSTVKEIAEIYRISERSVYNYRNRVDEMLLCVAENVGVECPTFSRNSAKPPSLRSVYGRMEELLGSKLTQPSVFESSSSPATYSNGATSKAASST